MRIKTKIVINKTVKYFSNEKSYSSKELIHYALIRECHYTKKFSNILSIFETEYY